MTIFSILFGRLPGLTQKTIGFLPVDVFTQEIITYESEVTEHPIETGGVVTDHIYNRPIGLRVRGTVRSENRSIGYQILQTLHEQRQPLFVVTGLQTFPRMAITSLIIPRDWRSASALEFFAEFRELEFVASAVTAAPATTTPSASAADTAAGTTNAGQVQASAASAASEAATAATESATGGAPTSGRTSILRQGFDALTGAQ